MKNFLCNTNKIGGVDLIIEDDNCNLIAFGTGNANESREFWRRMKSIAQRNMDQLEEAASVAVIHINENEQLSVGFMSKLKISR